MKQFILILIICEFFFRLQSILHISPESLLIPFNFVLFLFLFFYFLFYFSYSFSFSFCVVRLPRLFVNNILIGVHLLQSKTCSPVSSKDYPIKSVGGVWEREVPNVKKLEQLRRSRSKYYNDLLNEFECYLLSHECAYFLLTILFPTPGTAHGSWACLSDRFSFIIDSFKKKKSIAFVISGVEQHRGVDKCNKVSVPSIGTSNNGTPSLQGFPHIHLVVGVKLNSFPGRNSQSASFVSDVYRDLRSFVFSSFTPQGYDLDVRHISLSRHGLKRRLVYIFKDHKINEDVVLNLGGKISVFGFYSCVDLSPEVTRCLKRLSDYLCGNFVIVTSNDALVFTSNLDTNTKVKAIVEHYIRSHKLFISNSLFYHRVGTSTYKVGGLVLDLSSGIFQEYPEYYSLLVNSLQTNLKCISDFGLFDNFSLDYRYIEYADFILCCSSGFVLCKSKHVVSSYKCYHFFNVSYVNLLRLNLDPYIQVILGSPDVGMEVLCDEDEDLNSVFRFFRCLGRYLLSVDLKKGETVALYGASNSGKSFLTEFLFRTLFSKYVIESVDTTTSRFLLSGVNTSTRVVILNEFDPELFDSSKLLKLIDGSLVGIEKKYQNVKSESYKHIKFLLISNNNLEDYYGCRQEYLNRMTFFHFKRSINSLGVDYEDLVDNLPLFVHSCILASGEKHAINWLHQLPRGGSNYGATLSDFPYNRSTVRRYHKAAFIKKCKALLTSGDFTTSHYYFFTKLHHTRYYYFDQSEFPFFIKVGLFMLIILMMVF